MVEIIKLMILLRVVKTLCGFACGAVFIHSLDAYFHDNSLGSLMYSAMALYMLVLIACNSSR